MEVMLFVGILLGVIGIIGLATPFLSRWIDLYGRWVDKRMDK